MIVETEIDINVEDLADELLDCIANTNGEAFGHIVMESLDGNPNLTTTIREVVLDAIQGHGYGSEEFLGELKNLIQDEINFLFGSSIEHQLVELAKRVESIEALFAPEENEDKEIVNIANDSSFQPQPALVILREWLGGQEVINLSSSTGWDYFESDVTQDHEAATDIYDRFRAGETEIVVNESEPQYLERYTLR